MSIIVNQFRIVLEQHSDALRFRLKGLKKSLRYWKNYQCLSCWSSMFCMEREDMLLGLSQKKTYITWLMVRIHKGNLFLTDKSMHWVSHGRDSKTIQMNGFSFWPTHKFCSCVDCKPHPLSNEGVKEVLKRCARDKWQHRELSKNYII